MKKCIVCSKKFKPHPNRVGKFCSRECFSKQPLKREKVKCDYCGNIIFKYYSPKSTVNKKFCGNKCRVKYFSGERAISYRHGKSKSRVFRVWSNILERCNNKSNDKYEDYGGRGVVVCKEWHDSKKFIDWALANGYTDTLEIDRIDNDGDYKPSNCRFVTRKENCRNTRRTVTDFIKKTRRCRLCKNVYKLDLFLNNKTKPAGKDYICKECNRKDQKRRRKERTIRA